MPGNVRPVTDEQDALLSFLDHQRDVLVLTSFVARAQREVSASAAMERQMQGALIAAQELRGTRAGYCRGADHAGDHAGTGCG